jgi:hypothetical protein
VYEEDIFKVVSWGLSSAVSRFAGGFTGILKGSNAGVLQVVLQVVSGQFHKGFC